MTSAKTETEILFAEFGSFVRYYRSESQIPCPCRTPEGYRDPEWHLRNPAEPVCDPAGMLPDPDATTDVVIPGFVQPVTSARGSKLPAEMLPQLFGGEIEADDHIGMFPETWDGNELNFFDWSRTGQDFIEYYGRRFIVVNANLIPDPYGDPRNHWEVGLRLIGIPA